MPHLQATWSRCVKIFLLTHSREIVKKNNTGALVVTVLGDQAKVIVWERKNPNTELLTGIQEGSMALLYPSENSIDIGGDINIEYENYIVIDGTWQEARKIYNQSSYLHGLPTVAIAATKPSAYTLRRNQKANGLCTAECVIELCKCQGYTYFANELQLVFNDFITKNM